MGTILDGKIFQLRMEYDLTRSQTDTMTSDIIAENENLLAIMTTKEKEDFIYNELLDRIKSQANIDTTQEVHNIDIESGEYEDKEEGWCEIVSHEALRKSKYFNAYAMGVAVSNFNQEKQDFRSYIYKNELKQRITEFLEAEKEEFPDGKIPAVRTVEKLLTELLKCGIPLESIKIINTPNGVAYKLRNRVDNHWYIKLPYRQLKELVVATNRNMLKLFVVLKYTCNEDCKTFTTIDRKYLAREIGLSENAHKNLDAISTMLIALAKLGYIEIRQETRTDYDEEAGREIGKKINSYRLRSLEEYDNINLIARGRKPKK